MTQSLKSSESWLKMLIAAFEGALLTGSIQYILNERGFAQRMESESKDIVRKYLESELSYRRKKYEEIRRKVSIAIRTKKPQDRESARQALESDLPFFEARYATQTPISETSKRLLTRYFTFKTRISDMEAMNLEMKLRRDFQNDLNRIQGELFSLTGKLYR